MTDRTRSDVLGVAMLVGGLVVLVVGVVLVVWRLLHPQVAWFAYAPLSHQAFAPHVPPVYLVGFVLTAVGAAIAGFGGGLLVRRRSERSASRATGHDQ